MMHMKTAGLLATFGVGCWVAAIVVDSAWVIVSYSYLIGAYMIRRIAIDFPAVRN